MDHTKFMQRALRLATRGLGRVEPNPMVGCVLVRTGEIIAEGYHRKFGQHHAEAAAIAYCRENGIDTSGATAYVTLEPCSHHGKTPPCADALVEAGVKRVYIAMMDPFTEVSGRGIAKLEDAGIEVEVGLCEDEAKELNRPYLKRLATGQPWVIAKWAQTVDGYIATASGDSKWISNEQSRKTVHQVRARVDAVIVGIGTALVDDPSLTARGVAVKRVARRVVVDKNLDITLDCKLISSLSEPQTGPVIIATSEAAVKGDKTDALRASGVEIVGLPETGNGKLDLKVLLEHLSEAHQATNVLVEGGASLLGSFVEQGLVDQALIYVAPKLLGDGNATPAVVGMARDLIADASQMKLHKVKRLGDDVLLDYRF